MRAISRRRHHPLQQLAQQHVELPGVGVRVVHNCGSEHDYFELENGAAAGGCDYTEVVAKCNYAWASLQVD